MKYYGFKGFGDVPIGEIAKRGFKREKVQINEYSDFLEAPVGFEPTNKGFADLRLKPLGYSAL